MWMYFWYICGEEGDLQSYSSAILNVLPSCYYFFWKYLCFHIASSYFSSFLSFHLNIAYDIACRVNLVAIQSFDFCLSGNVLISPSLLKERFDRYRNVHCEVFSFILFSSLCLSSKIYAEKLSINLLRISCMWWLTVLFLLSRLSLCLCLSTDWL